MTVKSFQTGHGRVYLQRDGAGPGQAIEYVGQATLGAFAVPRGDIEPVFAPSAKQYDEFDVVDEIRGEEGLPTTSMTIRFGLDNILLAENCSFHLQARYGKCEDPLDTVGGWEKILGYERSRLSNIAGEQQTAIQPSDRAVILLTGDVTARKLWEIDKLSIAELAGTNVTGAVVDIMIADYISCGDCGYSSDGEQRIFAIAEGSGAGSPGLWSELLISADGGATWSEYDIDTLAIGEMPSAITVVSTTIVVVSQNSVSIHLAGIATPGTWVEVTEGFEALGAPNAISSVDSSHSWIVGEDGYIYFLTSIADGVHTVQSEGAVFAEDFHCVHALDTRHILAGGEVGQLVYSANSGTTWTEIVGPTVATINTVWMRTEYAWMVGTSNGLLYYTLDGGTTWAPKTFGLDGLGEVFDIGFAHHPDSPYGFLVATNAAGKGFIFRSLDCGASWYQMPDYTAVTPENHGLTCLSVGLTGNFAIAGGIADDDVDGIIVSVA